MKKKLTIRESLYAEDIKKAAKMSLLKKLKLSLELSDFCRYLQNKSLPHKK